jgi:hypothetical protein
VYQHETLDNEELPFLVNQKGLHCELSFSLDFDNEDNSERVAAAAMIVGENVWATRGSIYYIVENKVNSCLRLSCLRRRHQRGPLTWQTRLYGMS